MLFVRYDRIIIAPMRCISHEEVTVKGEVENGDGYQSKVASLHIGVEPGKYCVARV
ncbi:MAG: hypothetical protein VB027_02720 [Gordonibacter sp.]|nr:hypothetical protein [Gordonibacter sp.]